MNQLLTKTKCVRPNWYLLTLRVEKKDQQRCRFSLQITSLKINKQRILYFALVFLLPTDSTKQTKVWTILISLVETFKDMVVALSDIIVIISKEMAAASSRNYSPATQKKERKIWRMTPQGQWIPAVQPVRQYAGTSSVRTKSLIVNASDQADISQLLALPHHDTS